MLPNILDRKPERGVGSRTNHMDAPCLTYPVRIGRKTGGQKLTSKATATVHAGQHSPPVVRAYTHAGAACFLLDLLQDLERKPPIQLHPGGAEQGPNRACRSSLLTDYLAQIAGRDAEFENRDLLALYLADDDLIGNIYESLRNFLNEFLDTHPVRVSCLQL